MRIVEAMRRLVDLAESGRIAFAKADLREVFHEDHAASFNSTINRLVKERVLHRVANAVYINILKQPTVDTLEEVARVIRRGCYNYVSLESALSEYGVISQVPQCLTVMTTGRKGWFSTPMGSIRFTHTSRPISDILQNTVDVGRPLRFACKEAALRDLRRVGRSADLVYQMESAERGEAFA